MGSNRIKIPMGMSQLVSSLGSEKNAKYVCVGIGIIVPASILIIPPFQPFFSMVKLP